MPRDYVSNRKRRIKNEEEKFIGRKDCSYQRVAGSTSRMAMRLETYQLDLLTPGMSPWEASSRNVSRDILNLRMNARRRPVTSQRFTTRVGLALRGN